jgi:hypothetical protein
MNASNLTFVSVAYGLTWAVLIAYAWHVHAALRRARASYERAISKTREGK